MALCCILEQQRLLYNAALEERIGCYKQTGKGRTLYNQQKALTEWRKSDKDARSLPANLQRWTLKRLDDAFNGFFRRIRVKNGKAGFPRFRGFGRFNSFGFLEFGGITFNGKRLHFKGMPSLRVHLHRKLPKNADIRSCTFTKDHKGWSICFEILIQTKLRATERAIGIDVGLEHLATLSNGKYISNIKIAKNSECKLRIKQRALARCKRNSKRRQKIKRQLTCQHVKIKNTRRTYLHQVSKKLIDDYDLIAIEKLNIKGLAKSMLTKSIHDASWGILLNMLRYKAEKAGAKLIEVDPKYTSQDCSECGFRVPKTLRERIHNCSACGLTLDRDVNAARNILTRAVASPEVLNVEQ